jgi:hypothetical protein
MRPTCSTMSTLPCRGSMIYRWCDYEDWLRTGGFITSHRITLDTWIPHSVIEAPT